MSEVIDRYEHLRSLKGSIDSDTSVDEWREIKDEIDKATFELTAWAREAEAGEELDKVCFGFEYPNWSNTRPFKGYFEKLYRSGQHRYSSTWAASGRLFETMAGEEFDIALEPDCAGWYIFRLPPCFQGSRSLRGETPHLAIARGCALMFLNLFLRAMK